MPYLPAKSGLISQNISGVNFAKYLLARFSIPAPFKLTNRPVTRFTGKSFAQSCLLCSETYRVSTRQWSFLSAKLGYDLVKSVRGECNGSLCIGISSAQPQTFARAFAFP